MFMYVASHIVIIESGGAVRSVFDIVFIDQFISAGSIDTNIYGRKPLKK